MSPLPQILPAARTAARIAAIAGLAAGAFLALVAGPVQAQATPTATPAANAIPCAVDTRMGAWPRIVPAAAMARVTATLRFTCPGSETARRHIVFVVDASSSMAGDPRIQLSKAIGEYIDRTSLEGGRVEFAIVQYTSEAKVLCPLTGDRGALALCRTQIEANGGSCIDCGVAAAYDELVRARAAVPSDVELNESIILQTDGANAAGCEALVTAASRAKADGVHITSVAIGGAIDSACMRAAASLPRYFFEGRQAGQAGNIYDTIRRVLENGKIQFLSVRFVPAAGLSIDPESPGFTGEIDIDGSAAWHFAIVPMAGIDLELTLRPTVAGVFPALAGASGSFHDNRGNEVPITFDIPDIVVLGEGSVPTATPAAASPVRTSSLTLSPAQPRAGERARIDVRLALEDPIDPQGSHVMIVADTSGSMTGQPIDALRAAARALVARLPLGEDPSLRVGIVTFTQSAKLLVGLTDSRPALEAAIGQFSAAGGTCIDCGLRAGRDALTAGRPAPGVEDVIVLSDGESNQGCAPVVAEADAVKAEEITVHAVCLGGGCDTRCMRSAASPGHYHEALSAADLEATFAAIGDELLADRRYDAVAVRLALPPHLRFVSGSFDVAPDAGGDPYDARWTFRPLRLAGIAFGGEVEAVVDGSRPAVAVIEATERGGRVVRWAAEAAREVPTAAATPLGPTPAPVSSSEPTGTAVTPGAPWPGPRVYVPVAMRMP